MAKVKLAPSEIEGCLLDSCIAGDDQKLVIDLVRLFQSGTANKNPVEILVLRNLVSKLRKNNNHHYTALIKDLSGLFKNELGPTNYALLAEAFGLLGQQLHHAIALKLVLILELIVKPLKRLPVCSKNHQLTKRVMEHEHSDI